MHNLEGLAARKFENPLTLTQSCRFEKSLAVATVTAMMAAASVAEMMITH